MFRRVALVLPADLDALERIASREAGPLTIVFDIDNTLVPQGAAEDEFRNGVLGARRRFEAIPSVDRVVMLTNGLPRGARGIIARGNKPWTTRRRLGLDARTKTWVVGDQVLTDGLLAWRLGATFCHVVIDHRAEPTRQALMRWLGRIVTPVLFDRRTANSDDEAT
jgi:predicted HAD superfamily phosphohydrolase YqeG